MNLEYGQSENWLLNNFIRLHIDKWGILMWSQSLFNREFELKKNSEASMSVFRFRWNTSFFVGLHFDYSKIEKLLSKTWLKSRLLMWNEKQTWEPRLKSGCDHMRVPHYSTKWQLPVHEFWNFELIHKKMPFSCGLA